MKRFLGFIRKEWYHIFRDRRTLLILFGMPVVQILLFGFAIKNEVKDIHIGILDHSNDVVTHRIVDKIKASGFFIIEDNLHSEKQIEAAFKSGKIKVVLVFGENFGHNLNANHLAHVQILTDASNPNVATTISNYINAILRQYQVEINETQVLPMAIKAKERMLFNPELKSVFMFVPGIMTIILMLVTAMMTSVSIAREKELGTMEVLLVSPLKPFQIIIGKVFPYIFLALSNASIILLLGIFVFGMPVKGDYFFLALETALFIIATLSLGILISTIANDQQTAMMISMGGLMLPTIILSGFIFPISSMPWLLRLLSNIIPARWFIIIIKGILLKGVNIHFLWKETLVLAGMTIGFLFISIKRYKTRLE